MPKRKATTPAINYSRFNTNSSKLLDPVRGDVLTDRATGFKRMSRDDMDRAEALNQERLQRIIALRKSR